MTHFSFVLLADAAVRSVFQWGRIQSNSDWIVPVAVTLALVVLARMVYRNDARELRPAVGWTLTLLRTLALFTLLLLYLQPQWRTEQEKRTNSRALVLVDNSLSMGLADDATAGATRAGQVAAAIARSQLVERLRQRHDVGVFRFGEKLEPVLARDRLADKEKQPSPETVDWQKTLAPVASQTRLGDALAQLIARERDAPVSGIILFTDGGQNAGAGPESAIAAARQANLPVFPVGIGSDRQTASVRLSDFVVPPRAYPGDRYTATGYLQASGMAGRRATVELWVVAADQGATPSGGGELAESREVVLGPDGQVLPVRFAILPKAPGRQTLTLKVRTSPAGGGALDDHREADVEIVARKSRVLLLAGGPMREYRFLRGLLHRDKSVAVDVLLQSGGAGISQEADHVLADFPATRAEMYKYDAVVAMDPDWQALSDAQIELVEQWVAEQGGGLVVVAGTVNMGDSISGWTQDPRMDKIRALYPVKFQRRFATDAGSYASDRPWPLAFTREGRQAEFLWLAEDQAASDAAWASFPGVYGFFPVEGAKPGAIVLARFSDPQVGSPARRPVWAAVQFYGAGRVLYLGSGELWRLRAVDEAHFETIYMKLLRHVSQGRLLRGSPRGVLLADRDRYVLGSTVEVRAQLTDQRLEPLADRSVAMQVFPPRGAAQTVLLQADAAHPGSFAGRFPAVEEGVWRLELPIPQSDNKRLWRRIHVKMPDLEREHPERNDALLAQIAKQTGGHYFVGAEAALPPDGSPGVVGQLTDRPKTIIVTGTPSRTWIERWLRVFMYALCVLLLLEWLLRRLVRLA